MARKIVGIKVGTVVDGVATCTTNPSCAGTACCDSIAGWDGPGWYCVREAGSEDACAAVELLEADRCDTDIEICDGPFADEEAALAECGPVIAACCEEPMPRRMFIEFRDGTGIGTVFDGLRLPVDYIGLAGGDPTWSTACVTLPGATQAVAYFVQCNETWTMSQNSSDDPACPKGSPFGYWSITGGADTAGDCTEAGTPPVWTWVNDAPGGSLAEPGGGAGVGPGTITVDLVRT